MVILCKGEVNARLIISWKVHNIIKCILSAYKVHIIKLQTEPVV